MIFGAGLGGPIDDEYGSFGEPTDARLLAERLDEGLNLLDRYWSGEPVTHHGRHYHVEDVTLLPTPVQRPRVPVWIGGCFLSSASHGYTPPVDEVRDLVACVRDQRGDDSDRPFQLALGGATRRIQPMRATCSVH